MMAAKTAWARLAAECRTLRQALERVVQMTRRGESAHEVHDAAAEALEKSRRDKAA